MNRLKWVAAWMAAMAAVCAAQTVPTGYVLVSGSNTTDASGNVVENGTISFQPVDNSGNALSFRIAGGTGARATAVFGVTIAAQSPGAGYSGSWTCAVNGGTYTSQATCSATVSSGGLVFAITSAGSYTTAPTSITFSGGTYTAGTLASATPGMTLSGALVTAGGSGYTVTTASFPGCTGTITSAVTVTSGAVTSMTASGGSCPNGTTVVIASSGQAGPNAVSAQVTNGAFSILLGDSATATPQNVCYNVTIADNVTGNSLLGRGYTCVQPAGSGVAVIGSQAWCAAGSSGAGGTCNFDLYTPNLATGVVTQTGPAGPTGPQGAPGTGSIAGLSSDGNSGIAVTNQDAAGWLVDESYPTYTTAPFLGAAGGDHCQAMYLATEAAIGGTPGVVSNLQGPYSQTPTYSNGQEIYYSDGNVYEAQNSPPAGTLPTNATYWTKITASRSGFIIQDSGIPASGTPWSCGISPTYGLTPQAQPYGDVAYTINATYEMAPGATYLTNSPVVVPSGVKIIGYSPHPENSSGTTYQGTVFEMNTSFPTSTPMFAAIAPYGISYEVFGFGAWLQDIGVSCVPPSGTPISDAGAYYNGAGQEYTGFDHLETFGCWYGADIEHIASGSGGGAQYSGPYNRLKWHANGLNDPTAVCGMFGVTQSLGGPAKEANYWSCIGGANGSEGTAAVIIGSGSVNLSKIDCESWQYCVETNVTHSSAVGQVNIDTLGFGSNNFPATAGVYIGNKAATASVTVTNVTGSGQFLLQDLLPGGASIPAMTGSNSVPYLQLYIRNGSSVYSSSPWIPADIDDAQSVVLKNCSSGGGAASYAPVQNQSLTGGCAESATANTQALLGIWASGQADSNINHSSAVCTSGQCFCDFGNNSTTYGDWVQSGSKVCADVGTTIPTTWYLGNVQETDAALSAGTISSVTPVNPGSTSVTYAIVEISSSEPSHSAASATVTTTTSNATLTQNSATQAYNTVTISASPATGTVWAVCREASGAAGNGGTTGFIGYTTGTNFNDYGQLADGTACTGSNYTAAHVIAPVNVAIVNPAPASGVGGPSTTTTGDVACWNNTTGTLLSDCGAHGSIVAGQVSGCMIHSVQTAVALTSSFQTLYTCAMAASTMTSNSTLHCVAYWARLTPTTGVNYEWTFGSSGTANYGSSSSTASTGYSTIDVNAYGSANEQLNASPLIIGNAVAESAVASNAATETLSNVIDVELQVLGSTSESDELKSANCWVSP